jgi:hypothetical protein
MMVAREGGGLYSATDIKEESGLIIKGEKEKSYVQATCVQLEYCEGFKT